jgi:flagellar motor switch protein FliM
MTLRPYNFRKPDRPAGTLEQRLTVWLRTACQLAVDRGAQQLPFRLEITLRTIDMMTPAEALTPLSDAVLGYRLAFDDTPADMLFVWPRPLALALVNGALGETPTSLPEDRELTVVEQSLCEYLMQNLWAAVLQETWTGTTPLTLRLDGREPSPRWTRLFVKAEQVVRCTFTLRGPFGEQDWCWLAPYQSLHEHIAKADAADASLHANEDARKLEAVVRDLPVEVMVELGTVELPISQLAALTPGDLLILHRRVAEPLIVRVDGRSKFRGWSGRMGSRQSVQIESLWE